MKRRVDVDADGEYDSRRQRYEERLAAERATTLKLKAENGLMRKKFEALKKDIQDHKDEIKQQQAGERKRYEEIESLKKDIEGLKKEIREREDTIIDKVRVPARAGGEPWSACARAGGWVMARVQACL